MSAVLLLQNNLCLVMNNGFGMFNEALNAVINEEQTHTAEKKERDTIVTSTTDYVISEEDRTTEDDTIDATERMIHKMFTEVQGCVIKTNKQVNMLQKDYLSNKSTVGKQIKIVNKEIHSNKTLIKNDINDSIKNINNSITTKCDEVNKDIHSIKNEINTLKSNIDSAIKGINNSITTNSAKDKSR
eukprot:197935_1